MALPYFTSPDSDYSLGIDARSAENQIDPGFVRDLLNADIVEKRVRKRRGYQSYAGNMPVRVTEMQYLDSTNQIVLSLDGSISLENVRSSPIVVYGRSSSIASGGPFTTTDAAKYYASFSTSLRKSWSAGTSTTVISGTEHGLGTTNMFVSVVESTDSILKDYQRVLTDSISVAESGYALTVGYTSATARDVFIYYTDKSTVTGDSYVHAATGVGTGTQTISIPAATHNLANYNIIPQIQQDLGATRQVVDADSFEIAANGDITITVTNGTGGSVDYYVLLSAVDAANYASGAVGAGSTGTVVIPNLESPWLFYGIYLEQTAGGVRELVYPDTIEYDDTNAELTLTFTNSSSTAKNFIVHYEYGEIRSNQLSVTDATVTVDATDSSPQLTIWGLEHSELYPSKVQRESWVTHIDSYRRSGESRMVAGLGGLLHTARTYSESGTTYLYSLLYPNLVARTSTATVLGPLFWETGAVPARTRGYITCTSGSTNWATVSAVEYDSGTGYTRYTLSLPSKQILDSSGSTTTLSSVISTTTNLEDYLTVRGMSYSRHEGSFRIRQVTDGSDLIYVYVDNEENSADYDDTGCAGQAGVFTDQLGWTANAPFVPGDTLVSETLGDLVCTVFSSSSTTTVADGFADLTVMPAGVLFNGSRTSNVLPLRAAYPSGAASVTNLVRGDMLSYPGIERLLRILRINPDSDRAVTITVLDGVATATLGSGDTTYLAEGGSILLVRAGAYSGTQVITGITSSTTFTFDTEETASGSGTLLGATIEIDESLEWADSFQETTPLRVEERWIPVEAPDDSFSLTATTHPRYFDACDSDDQPFLRSTTVQDNLYLTNYWDEVMKFDGSNLYRAGLPSWQPEFSMVQDTAGATIVTNLRQLSYSARVAAEGLLTITAANTNVIPVGTPVRLSGSTGTYTVREYRDDGTDYYVVLDRALDSGVSASGTVSEIGTYRYYHRLNAVDVNGNIVASAVTGYQDNAVELTGNAAVIQKLVALPAWGEYDYDRLEVQTYRTKMNQAAPFYLITTQALDFDNTQGYLEYRDSFADSDLTQLDIVTTALKGTELGTSWSSPLRSKYITSLGNRLVQGNIRDYPQLDLQIVAPATVANSDFAGDSLLFRRDSAGAQTVTDMVNCVKYEWINGFTGTASAHAIGTDQFSFTTSSPHGASIGDWVYLTYATVATSARTQTYSGWWQIAAIPSSTELTVNLLGAAAATDYPNRYVVATDPTNIPVLLGTDGNLGMRNGDSFDLFDSMRRMATAINATMRMCDTTITGMSTFTPWLTARSGNDVGTAGRLIVRQERSDAVTFEVVPTFSGYSLFVNSIRRTSADQISASTKVFPSRILISYENYPEIFDNPTAVLDSESDSAIDINSADGQEITGIIPFFGDAAFGASQQSGVLVVFKSNSIYLVDINQKVLGLNAIQRIETEGLGCTAPYSIAVTRGGIMFANESGIYCLRRNQTIEYIGRAMERNWTDLVALDRLELCHGHHYGIGRSYKLSLPLISDVDSNTDYVENDQVYVYNHTGESSGRPGSWSRYDNHPSIGWANLGEGAYFASTSGRVFSVRNTGEEEDFRDDSSAITFRLDTRPNSFGDSAVRKVVNRIVIHYRNQTSTETSVQYALDLEKEYSDTTDVTLTKHPARTSLSDPIDRDIISVAHSVDRRRCTYFSLRIENSSSDTGLEITGIDHRVAGLTDKGLLESSSTNSR